MYLLSGVGRCYTRPTVRTFVMLLGFGFGILLLEEYLQLSKNNAVYKTKMSQTIVNTSRRFFSFFDNLVKKSELVIDTENLACSFPNVDPFNPNIMKLAGLHKKTLRCDGYKPDLTYVRDNRLVVNKTRFQNTTGFKHCKFQNLFRHPKSDKNFTSGNWSEPFTNDILLPDSTEFILTVCENNRSEIISKTYYALLPEHKELEELELLRLKKRKKQAAPVETMNIIMAGLDGLSRHQFLRSMNLTYTFLTKELSSFDMTMHTQDGTNTFPNYVPLLTGRNDYEVEQWWDSSKHTDVFDLIWHDFTQAGYRTLYTEDEPTIGGFHFLKQGFLKTPTTYYSHPVSSAIEQDSELFTAGKHCAGNQPEIVFHFDYITRFLDKFPGKPLYAMSFHSKLTHGDMTNCIMADELIYTFYKSLQKKGQLNNTLLITFSDHGPRWGAIRPTLNGMVESRAPYLILTFPKWFLDKYPDAARNLQINTRRLTTHFDTHATLQDLMYFKAKGIVPLARRKHGISLFEEIPKNRSCEDVPIAMEYCLCNQATMQTIPSNNTISAGFAELILRSINAKRNKTICVAVTLKEILQIIRITMPTVYGSKDKLLYKVKIQTTPGDAIYEGTVQTPQVQEKDLSVYFKQLVAGTEPDNAFSIDVGETIDRLTYYKGQADCEANASKRPFCYCKELIK